MELLEFKNKILSICNATEISQIRDKLFEAVMKNDVEFYNNFLQITDDTKDWLQALWQYYEADRTEKKQDYTPLSLCKLVSALSGDCHTIYDCCGGSGALTLQILKDKSIDNFVIEELDDRVIPFLLFNLCLRNKSGYVVNRDVLTKETYACYKIEASDKFSVCEKVECVEDAICDTAISNPPYNIKWNAPTEIEALLDDRFPVIPPASNANYAFVLNCLSRAKNKVVMILPNGICSEDTEKQARRYLIENDLVEMVLTMPDKMFEVTTISTCILVLNKNKQHKGLTLFVDCRKNCVQEEREQNGQFGGNSHMRRTYTKTYNALSDENISKILNALQNWQDVPEFCAIKSNEEIAKNDYVFIPSRYIPFEAKEQKHRSFQDIADSFNYIAQMQNSCKLVINETIAQKLGLDVETFKQSKKQSEEMKAQMKTLGIDIASDDYIQFTKNKNEFVFKCNDKELLPECLLQFLSVWKNQIAMLNVMQNKYLAELRDALLPDLMSGTITISKDFN